jgi:hypothetical protein
MDAPNPTDDAHQHLSGHQDTTRALVALRRAGGAHPVLAPCVLCCVMPDLP